MTAELPLSRTKRWHRKHTRGAGMAASAPCGVPPLVSQEEALAVLGLGARLLQRPQLLGRCGDLHATRGYSVTTTRHLHSHSLTVQLPAAASQSKAEGQRSAVNMAPGPSKTLPEMGTQHDRARLSATDLTVRVQPRMSHFRFVNKAPSSELCKGEHGS